MSSGELVILICAVDGSLDRPDLENIEGAEFTRREFDAWASGKDGVMDYNLSDFMDAWNNEEICEVNNWIGYIYIAAPDADPITDAINLLSKRAGELTDAQIFDINEITRRQI